MSFKRFTFARTVAVNRPRRGGAKDGTSVGSLDALALRTVLIAGKFEVVQVPEQSDEVYDLAAGSFG